MSVRKPSHGTIFLIVSSGSPRALIASSLRSTSKKPFCPMTRSLHPPMTACGHRVRFVATWREEFFEVPNSYFPRVTRCQKLPEARLSLAPDSAAAYLIELRSNRIERQHDSAVLRDQPRNELVRE